MFRQVFCIYQEKTLNMTQKRVKNLIALFRYKLKCQKGKIIEVVLAMFLFFVVVIGVPKKLKVYFVDVGQGDCTFMVTPKNKTILIDGGGSLNKEFNVGKKIVIPYLLDRGYTMIDFVVISHFDQDHVRTVCFQY